MKQKLRVIDFFCGAGGFSEGFRQQEFDVVMGIDNWSSAVDTHNFNHNLNDKKKDVLDFGSSVEQINNLPDTEVIIGSPPCVLFSFSNRGGKSEKTLGINLIESFLRVVAVKKYQRSSKLIAWFMENVPNSRNYIKPTYSFKDLNLEAWAKQHGFNPKKNALSVNLNGDIINAADFGVPQKRERFVCGEIVNTGKFPDLSEFKKIEHRSLGNIRKDMPPPNMRRTNKLFSDPNYPQLKLMANDISDHFYDTGVYENQWQLAKYTKVNHPFMGKMAFPEDSANPSRTIMATRSVITREALEYTSEHKRKGGGEYRLPTIREVATLMGFPYSYQFSGGETTKWRQIGNAVCPQIAAALAKSVRRTLGLKAIPDQSIKFNRFRKTISPFENLNSFSKKRFDNPPKKNPNAKFRKHPFKGGNMTVALTNFNPLNPTNKSIKWHSFLFMGAGRGFLIKAIPKNEFKELAKIIESYHSHQGKKFITEFDKKFRKTIGNVHKFQEAYVGGKALAAYNPTNLIEEIANFILIHEPDEKYMKLPSLIPEKDMIPSKHVLAMYAINR